MIDLIRGTQVETHKGSATGGRLHVSTGSESKLVLRETNTDAIVVAQIPGEERGILIERNEKGTVVTTHRGVTHPLDGFTPTVRLNRQVDQRNVRPGETAHVHIGRHVVEVTEE